VNANRILFFGLILLMSACLEKKNEAEVVVDSVVTDGLPKVQEAKPPETMAKPDQKGGSKPSSETSRSKK
jgi:hypothetical protein